MGLFNKIGDLAKKGVETATKGINAVTSSTGSSNAQTSADAGYYFLDPKPMDGPTECAGEQYVVPTLEKISGTARSFSLNGKVIEVSAGLDKFNSYRSVFTKLAYEWTQRMFAEYDEKVTDFKSFVEVFPTVYNNNLHPLIQAAVDLIISEEIWSVTTDEFSAVHKQNFDTTKEAYDLVIETARKAIDANTEFKSAASSLVFDILGTKASGALTSSLVEVGRGIGEGVAQTTGLNSQQQADLFSHIEKKFLAKMVYCDYFCVCYTLAFFLKENGVDVWCPNGDEAERKEKAEKMLKNMSNPNFPEDKRMDVILGIFKDDPYNKNCLDFIAQHYGESDEAVSLLDYLGYQDMNNEYSA